MSKNHKRRQKNVRLAGRNPSIKLLAAQAKNMDVRKFEPMSTRPCKYCLALQDHAVFADFQINENGNLYLVRISYDGYGCCEPENKIMGIEITNTNQLISAIESNNLKTQTVTAILSGYFRAHKDVLWEDALLEHKLI